MEYEVVITNVFATFDVVHQLAGGGSLLHFIQDDWLSRRPFIGGISAPRLSVSVRNQLAHLRRMPVHIGADFALYQLSSKGSFSTDYYHLPDNHVLVYERKARFAHWESVPTPPTYEEHDILDSPLGTAEWCLT